jgi:hypothetical protein
MSNANGKVNLNEIRTEESPLARIHIAEQRTARQAL